MKTFVLDTNILLDDPESLKSFPKSHVVVPYEVLLELEGNKTRHDLVGKNARKAIRNIDEFRSFGSLIEHVNLDHGGTFRITLPIEETYDIDLAVIKIAQQLQAELITNDISMRLRAEAYGLKTNPFFWSKKELEFRDRKEISLSSEEKNNLFDNGKIIFKKEEFLPNEFVISEGVLCVYRNKHLHLLREGSHAFGIKARSKEQEYALNVLLNPKIPLVSLTGKAGCGKTLLAMACALEQTLERDFYEKIIITRPIQPLGKDIGFLPGDMNQKLEPWLQPLNDSLMYLMKKRRENISFLFEKRTIEVQALTYIRGRSLPNVFMIVDESQNLSRAEIKAIVTRMGEGSKIVFTGDLNQIDTNRSDRATNGLFYLIDKMKESDLSAHINLIKGERSDLASLAADLL